MLLLPSADTNMLEDKRGYGMESLPTYEKGWRYVIPFLKEGEEADPENVKLYY